MATRSSLFRMLATSSALALVLAAAPVSLDSYPLGAPIAHAKCCFTADTPVRMADGSLIPISGIRPGDRVMSGSGTSNRVLGLHQVVLGDRLLHGVNDILPFFTAEHPFLSYSGWVAIDPVAGAREVKGLRLSLMESGTLLARLTGPVCWASEGSAALDIDPGIEWIAVRKITAAIGAADLTVYNLLLDGDHTYIANGFVVHNKDGGDGGGGDGGGGEGGDSDGGSDSSGSGSDGSGESGESSGNSGSSDSSGSGSGDSDDGGESGDDGGESGDDGDDSSGSSSSGEGGDSGFDGSAEPAGGDLTPAEEAAAISGGWQ